MVQERFYFKNKKSIIKSLSENEIESVIDHYQFNSSLEIQDQNLKRILLSKKMNLYYHLPYELSDIKCHCNHQLYYKITPKTNQLNQRFICLSCGHYEAPWCKCEKCVAYRNQRREDVTNEFIACMLDYLFPEKIYENDSFENQL